MKFQASLYFAKSLIFPKTQKKTAARKSLLGSIICIALSVIPLVTVICVTTGSIKGMTERLIGLSSGHLELKVASGIEENASAKAFTDYARSFVKIRGITAAYAEVNLSALCMANGIRSGAFIRGVETDIFSKNKSFLEFFEVIEGQLPLSDGHFDDGSEWNEKQAVIGQKMAESLSLHAGDAFRIITTRSRGGNILPKISTFKVSAVITSGYQEMDQLWIFIPLQTFYDTFSMENASFNILLESEDPFSPELVRLQHQVKKLSGPFANVFRWDQVNAARFENFSSTKVMLVVIMMMIVLVAGINISSAIVMLVMERRKEIAILKSVGASPGGIALSFVLTGLFCGFTGALAGAAGGIVISVFINQIISAMEHFFNLFSDIHLMDPAYYLQHIPVTIPAGQIFLVIAATLILSFVVSLLPSVRAGQEKPADAFRN